MSGSSELTVQPIGRIHSPFGERADAPRQPRAAEAARAVIELFPGHGYEDALSDIERWQYLWVVFWLHRSEGWRPRVLPPRSDRKRGVFATRSPHRPNPIGLSVVRLERVEGLRLHVSQVDLLDGTPVLDIKPYVAWSDAIPDAGSGWLGDDQGLGGRPADPQPDWDVELAERAEQQLSWLSDRLDEDLRGRILRTLALGPQPHAYRRIRREGDDYRLAVKDWRARFRVRGRRIEVLELGTGYRPRQLRTGSDAGLELHREFVERFGWPG